MGDEFGDNIFYFIPVIALNTIIILVVGFLSFLFIKNKSFHDYSCYYVIIYNWILLIDNLFRILPFDDNDKDGGECQKTTGRIQGFVLVFLDKLILAIITSQTIIYYLGYYKADSYFSHERLIFFLTLFLSLIISGALSIIIYLEGDKTENTNVYNQIYCYCESSKFKELADPILNGIYLLINLYCILVLFRYISRKKKEAESGLIEDLDYKHHYVKILLMLFVNPLLFIEIFIIVHADSFIENNLILNIFYLVIDIVYLTTLLLIDLVYSLNKIIFKETLKIFCKKTYKEKFEKIKKALGDKGQHEDDDEDDDDNNTKLKKLRTESF
jgi:hypothetical protein